MAVPERRAVLTKAPVKEHPLDPTPPAPVEVPGPASRPEAPTTAQISPTSVGVASRPFATRLPPGLADAVKIHAAVHHVSIQDIVTEALTRYLAAEA